MVESSPSLRELQAETLTIAEGPEQGGPLSGGGRVHWHDSFSDVPDGPLLVVGQVGRSWQRASHGCGLIILRTNPHCDRARLAVVRRNFSMHYRSINSSTRRSDGESVWLMLRRLMTRVRTISVLCSHPQ